MPTRAAPLISPFVASTALLLVLVSVSERPPHFVWNVSPSVPVGLYVLDSETLRVGDTVVLHLPPLAERLAVGRRYLPASGLLLKPIAAIAADRVCRWQAHVLINGRVQAKAALRDSAGRLLPTWQGCRLLRPDELFVLSPLSGSFDSRYFGPLPRNAVIGIARPLITFD